MKANPLPAEGVLPDTLIRDAIESGWIVSNMGIQPEGIQPASLDLRLGDVAYRLRSSFLPGKTTVWECLSEHQIGPEIPLKSGAVLERNRPYLIPLVEQLQLPTGVRGRTNPKSSIGRLDIFTRVVVDRSPGFDEVPDGYQGPLYLEIVSHSFTIQVKAGLSLNQIRLIHGNMEVSDRDILRMHAQSPLVFTYENDDRDPHIPNELTVGNGLFLTVDLLEGANKVIGYKAKENSKLLDLSDETGHAVRDFWEPVDPDGHNRLILEPEKFYLLVSTEGIAIPADVAGEMTAYDPTSGELRTHYAGFFDPGFGQSVSNGIVGSRAVLEVRAHEVPFALEHGQKIARLVFERMIRSPEKLYGPEIGSSYQNQRLKLSKFFRDAL